MRFYFLLLLLTPTLFFSAFAQTDSLKRDSVIPLKIIPPVNLFDTLNYYQTKYDTSWFSGKITYHKSDTNYSKENCTINVIELAKRDSTILIIGGIHGNELSGIDLSVDLINYCKKLPDDSFSYKLVIIPILNPDGVVHYTRTNSNMVDINRNFATKNFEEGKKKKKKAYYCGEEPMSEIETRLVADLVNKYKPFLIVTIHSPYACINYDGPALSYATKVSKLDSLPVKNDIGYKVSGTMGIYFGTERNIPILTIELSEKDKHQWLRHKAALINLLGISLKK